MLLKHTPSANHARLGLARRDLPSRRARQVLRCSGVLVDRVVVQPAYRSTPWEAEAAKKNSSRALVMFVSESGVCRAPLAAAAFQQLLQQSPIRDWVTVAARASRDYCLGQPPDPAAVAAGQQLGIDLAASAAADLTTAVDSTAAAPAAAAGGAGAGGAVQFAPATDIVAADLVLVMDKYTAADVLREVSSYDLINPGGAYSSRVRLLGSFHPRLSAAASASSQTDVADIDDPLYGNVGGDEEQEAVLAAADMIQESCSNLLRHLESLADAAGLLDEHQAAAADGRGTGGAAAAAAAVTGGSEAEAGGGSQQQPQEEEVQKSKGELFRDAVVRHVRANGVIEWLVPPMLQGNTDLGGWV